MKFTILRKVLVSPIQTNIIWIVLLLFMLETEVTINSYSERMNITAIILYKLSNATCRAKLENVVVVGSNKCVWVQLDSECCEFVSPKDRDPGSYNRD